MRPTRHRSRADLTCLEKRRTAIDELGLEKNGLTMHQGGQRDDPQGHDDRREPSLLKAPSHFSHPSHALLSNQSMPVTGKRIAAVRDNPEMIIEQPAQLLLPILAEDRPGGTVENLSILV